MILHKMTDSAPSAQNLLATAFAIIDESATRAAATLQNRALACQKGCYVCCMQPIPLTPLELFRIIEYARMQLTPAMREKLLEELKKWQAAPALKRPCPFLCQKNCAIYSIRPFSCRRYLVAGSPCQPGEDASSSRPGDMVIPDRKSLDQALLATFPWYAQNAHRFGLPGTGGHITPADKLAYLKNITTVIQSADWQKIFSS